MNVCCLTLSSQIRVWSFSICPSIRGLSSVGAGSEVKSLVNEHTKCPITMSVTLKINEQWNTQKKKNKWVKHSMQSLTMKLTWIYNVMELFSQVTETTEGTKERSQRMRHWTHSGVSWKWNFILYIINTIIKI